MDMSSASSWEVPLSRPPVHEGMREECRDFLRTGRCKYGASCKYYHPPNVQSGGGMKAPMNPLEPMFPVRPNEPLCQYYMKHGTCKFGQSCKFHHPPDIAAEVGLGGYHTMRRANDPPPIVLSTGNGDSVQILPQRPDEPNCIFFLKNGRCKYGATCRYHHPVNVAALEQRNRRPVDDGLRVQHIQLQQGPDGNGSGQGGNPKVHYVASLPTNYQPGHFVVSNGNIAFVTMDGGPPTQVISVPQQTGNGSLSTNTGSSHHHHDGYPSPGGSSLGKPLGLSREVASSTSSTSIASSYDTSGSAGELYVQHGDSSSALWTSRPSSRSGSAGNLSAYNNLGGSTEAATRGVTAPHTVPVVQGNRTILFQASGDGTYTPVTSTANQGEARAPWTGRTRRSASFDHTRGPPASNKDMQKSPSVPDSLSDRAVGRSPARRPPPAARPPSRRHPPEVDDGLSMMTSALLTMLDTTEEGAHENYEDGEPESQSSTPQTGHFFAPRPRDRSQDNGGVSFDDSQFMDHSRYMGGAPKASTLHTSSSFDAGSYGRDEPARRPVYEQEIRTPDRYQYASSDYGLGYSYLEPVRFEAAPRREGATDNSFVYQGGGWSQQNHSAAQSPQWIQEDLTKSGGSRALSNQHSPPPGYAHEGSSRGQRGSSQSPPPSNIGLYLS